jgi:hypothetical protein
MRVRLKTPQLLAAPLPVLACLVMGCGRNAPPTPAPPARIVDHVAAAKAAEQSFHAACDEWAAEHAKGKDTSAAETRISQSYHDFIHHALETRRFKPCALNLVSWPIAGAGNFTSADGGVWTYLLGADRAGLMLTVFKREEWHDTTLPRHGLAVQLAIEPQERVAEFIITSVQPDATQRGLLKAAYRLNGESGVIGFRQVGEDWEAKPDRGIVVHDGPDLDRWQAFDQGK